MGCVVAALCLSQLGGSAWELQLSCHQGPTCLAGAVLHGGCSPVLSSCSWLSLGCVLEDVVFMEVFTHSAEGQGYNVLPCTPVNCHEHVRPCLPKVSVSCCCLGWLRGQVRILYCCTILALLAHCCVSLGPITGLGSDLSHRVAAASLSRWHSHAGIYRTRVAVWEVHSAVDW